MKMYARVLVRIVWLIWVPLLVALALGCGGLATTVSSGSKIPPASTPTITSQPTSQAIAVGQTATFTVTANGTLPLGFQWEKNGVAIGGATSASYTTPAATASDNGAKFVVLVSNSQGSATSASALLTVTNSGSTPSDCTLYASPSGSGGNSGASSSAPKDFFSAAAAAVPGSVVCLLSGTYHLSSTFTPPSGGTPSAWIIYKAYSGAAVTFAWTGPADGEPIFKMGNGSFPSGPAYLEFQGFKLDGNNYAANDGFFCHGGHHLKFIGNTISNTGGSGVGAVHCDYITADHNIVNHNGYIPSSTGVPQYYSWTSGISLANLEWFDNYQGLHNIISNNIVAGEVDQTANHSDGNGVILDLGANSTNTPASLVVNNVVYGNGGHCIETNQAVTSFYFINNTCYKNDLDTSEPSDFAAILVNGSSNGYIANNIAVVWQAANPPYTLEGGASNVAYYRNLSWGGSCSPSSLCSSSQFIIAGPLFLAPPSLAAGGFTAAPPPSLLGDGLALVAALSPGLGQGIDPGAIPGLPSAVASDLQHWVYTDINGTARPHAGADLGAYQH